MYRDYLLGELNLDNVGQEVTLSGWVDSIRDHGGLIFVDLRDYSGKTQIVIHPEKESLARKLKPEFVIQIKGEVRKRSKESINPNIPTGEIEVELADVVVLNESLPLPFEIDDDSVGEVLKYKYRYLSLRNQSNYRRMKMRSNMMKVVKDFFHRNNFLEIDTPILTKSTPEGARDFLVP
ncbi:MAG TPA: Asp-tRNA(Asn)/Glu-tRNA(Gln) amidotransferase GatCAB subunit C, partial [Fusobacteria bacterium]|nr:Asp-tRNA(Asn)/Glu-tRNA(Gln) amidotransferase GatCAB subunit C [Fusobacteriota bacterium]